MKPLIPPQSLVCLCAMLTFVNCTGTRQPNQGSTESGTPRSPRSTNSATNTGNQPRVPTTQSRTVVEPPLPQPTEQPSVSERVTQTSVPVQRSTTPNGIPIEIVSIPTLPLTHVHLVIQGAGFLSESEDQSGLSVLTAYGLLAGTRTHPSADLLEALETTGAQIRVQVLPEAAILKFSVPTDRLEDLLILMGEMLTDPTFPATEIDRFRNPNVRAVGAEHHTLPVSVFGEPPASRQIRAATLSNLNRSLVENFFRARYISGALGIVLTGQIPQNTQQWIARSFARVRRGNLRTPGQAPTPPAYTRRINHTPRSSPNVTDTTISFSSPRVGDTRYFIWRIVAQALLTRLETAVAPEHRSRFTVDIQDGETLLRCHIQNAELRAKVQQITATINQQLRSPLTEQELSAETAVFLNTLDRLEEAPASRADIQSTHLAFGLPLDYFNQARALATQPVATTLTQANALLAQLPQSNQWSWQFVGQSIDVSGL